MEEWFVADATYGFALMFPTIPEDWLRFMNEVIAELQRRGLVPYKYAPGTVLDRLNLAKPLNQFSK